MIKKADIILPNITEACFMTGMEFIEGVQTKEYINQRKIESLRKAFYNEAPELVTEYKF